MRIANFHRGLIGKGGLLPGTEMDDLLTIIAIINLIYLLTSQNDKNNLSLSTISI